MRLLGREQSRYFIAHRRGAALVGVQAENPLAAARLHRAVAQITARAALDREARFAADKANNPAAGCLAHEEAQIAELRARVARGHGAEQAAE